jgi:hypothetical protein
VFGEGARGERRRDATWSLVEGVAADEMYDMDGPRRKGAVRGMGGTRNAILQHGHMHMGNMVDSRHC